jgi:two-component system response regulator HydG
MSTGRGPIGLLLSQETLARVERWSRLPYPILITGEQGSGKSELARRIEELSGREGPYISFSMGQLPPNLEYGELRGYRKGAFTDAREDHAGIFEQAFRGVVHLEELERASRESQGLLLGIIETGRVVRIMESRSRPLDFRLVASSNADLSALVDSGEFAADLLSRFGFYRFELAPLRERRSEILPLAAEFLIRESERCGRAVPVLGPEVRRALLSAPWPGNIRDLLSVCCYLAGNSGDQAGLQDLPEQFLRTLGLERHSADRPLREQLSRILAETGGNKSEAARRCGISRQYLYVVLGRKGAPPA